MALLCRPLIFLATPELAPSLLVSALPPSVVLHHLYSRAPEALQSPHARSGFTPAQVMTRNTLKQRWCPLARELLVHWSNAVVCDSLPDMVQVRNYSEREMCD